jgi:excisionase family DNA binding protein
MIMKRSKKSISKLTRDLDNNNINAVMESLAQKYDTDNRMVRIQFPDQSLELEVNPFVFHQLLTVIRLANQGKKVEIVTDDELLTTQEVANRLHVSRPFVIKLLEQGSVPFVMVGKHRRVRSRDVAVLQKKMQHDRSKSLDELAIQAQELDLGY